MSPDLAAPMLAIPAGEIVLRDEGTRTTWKVDLQPFQLAPVPVTRALASCRRKNHPTARSLRSAA